MEVDVLDQTNLTVSIELGRAGITLAEALEYGDQSLIELNRAVGERVDILMNGTLFAKGEVVTVSENFAVRIVEIVNPQRSEVQMNQRTGSKRNSTDSVTSTWKCQQSLDAGSSPCGKGGV